MTSVFRVSEEEMKVTLPLTSAKGKIRVKERNFFYDNGKSFPGRSRELGVSNYVEWQIGFDLLANPENAKHTTLKDCRFNSFKGELKYPYELSEILYHSFHRSLISEVQVRNAYSAILSIPEDKTLDLREEMEINRTEPVSVMVNGMPFYRMAVKYPILVHKFGRYDIYAEVSKKEQQNAAAIQPMLYVCIPITALRFKSTIIGRKFDVKETADWVIGKDEAELALELFRIFGMLSPKHRFDVVAIFQRLFTDILP